MKLWVDDERPAPDGEDWLSVRSSQRAIETIKRWDEARATHQGVTRLEEVSLDHDLGGEDTGFKVLDWMIEHNIWPEVLTIHTSNPPARKRMLQAANVEAPMSTSIFVITDHLKKDNE